MPSIRLKKYIKIRAKFCCGICGEKKLPHELEIHHIIFRRNGGTDDPDNLIALDILCHRAIHQSKQDLSQWLKAKAKHQEDQLNPPIPGIRYA